MPPLTKSKPAARRFRPRAASILLPTLGIAVLLLFVGLVSYQGASAQKNTADQGQQSRDPQNTTGEKLDMARRIADDPTAIGSPDAPVVLVEYADFRCPFCGLFSRDTLPPLVAKYVERGDLRVEWRDLPVFGAQSNAAAVAGRAAGAQGRFWEFNKAVYAIAPERGHAELPRERLIELARDAGMPDMRKFEADLDSPELKAAVSKDAQEAASIGATGTPTFLVNDTPLVGAQPLASFERAIDAALKSAKSN
ncbi:MULTISPECIES: DsbA family protein [unclassified Arthrobacter]|uniref:DsbA family protein n=1 Tax=unclassified Arthrobacter TaxID=235627 RepID=UPI002E0C8FA9|nr:MULTISPECIES: DsbA family protein [unclassified Arthrobacter]MEC5193366.1 protein-disulfide isomerase [Arthrobacter sp. MP_M4]MEC5204832.1 protein-disulfide isomerase [Arthrobacter sp. MP_M7]